MTSRWPRPIFYFALMLSIALDQATKAWATDSLAPIGSVTIIPGLFNLTYVGNTGVAFGMLAGHGLLVALLMVALALAAIFFARGRPFGTAAVAVLFGAATALAVRLPEMTGTAPQLLELVPYAVTLLALIAVGLRSLRSRGRYRTQHFDT